MIITRHTMNYTVKNKKRDTYIQEPFSERIIEAFNNYQKEVSVGEGTIIKIVDHKSVDVENIIIYVEVE